LSKYRIGQNVHQVLKKCENSKFSHFFTNILLCTTPGCNRRLSSRHARQSSSSNSRKTWTHT